MKEQASEIYKEKKYKEAIEQFNECLELDTMNANFNSSLLLNISKCYNKLEN